MTLFVVKKMDQFLPSNRVIYNFFKKKSDLFSAIQGALFAILKSIFEKLLFLGSNIFFFFH